ncbi:MAG: hypothetical protein LBV67_02375 [Streptococcaceae bacterium]|jgi:hypothetical protein|nr:hypothetical protein [Streptococcaceae bacterium]
MSFKIISNRDKDGNFIAANEAWTREKIEELMDKYYPKRIEKREKEKKDKK